MLICSLSLVDIGRAKVVYILELFIAGEQRVGNKKADPKPDILLSGLR